MLNDHDNMGFVRWGKVGGKEVLLFSETRTGITDLNCGDEYTYVVRGICVRLTFGNAGSVIVFIAYHEYMNTCDEVFDEACLLFVKTFLSKLTPELLAKIRQVLDVRYAKYRGIYQNEVLIESSSSWNKQSDVASEIAKLQRQITKLQNTKRELVKSLAILRKALPGQKVADASVLDSAIAEIDSKFSILKKRICELRAAESTDVSAISSKEMREVFECISDLQKETKKEVCASLKNSARNISAELANLNPNKISAAKFSEKRSVLRKQARDYRFVSSRFK